LVLYSGSFVLGDPVNDDSSIDGRHGRCKFNRFDIGREYGCEVKSHELLSRKVREEIGVDLVSVLAIAVVDLGFSLVSGEDIHAVDLLITLIFFAIILLELLEVC
jgi:hypothetical protein